MKPAASGTDFRIAEALARIVVRCGDASYSFEIKQHLKSELGWSDSELAQFDELITRFEMPSTHELSARRAAMFNGVSSPR
jgi:hypothetical protein